jgi:hypothetical protein
MRAQEIKVEVEFTDGYQKRFTEACIKRIARRDAAAKKQKGAQAFPACLHEAVQAQG